MLKKGDFMKKVYLILSFLMAAEVFAIPRFAIMRGNQCRDCHSNPTG